MKTEGGLFVGDITQGLPRPRDWQEDGGRAPPQLLGKDPNDEADDSHLSNSRHARHSSEPTAQSK